MKNNMKIKSVIVNNKECRIPKYTAESDGLTDAFYEPDLDLFIIKFGEKTQLMIPRENVGVFTIETEEDNDISEFKIVERD